MKEWVVLGKGGGWGGVVGGGGGGGARALEVEKECRRGSVGWR